MATKWKITLDNFLGGFAPAWYLNSYPSYGNKNMAGDMLNCDLSDPHKLTQGPGLVALTNGTQAGNVSDMIKGILDKAQASNLSFAVGTSGKFYEITPTTVSTKAATPVLPHQIAGTNPVGEDVAYYKGEIYYSHYDDNGGDIGKYDLTRDAEADFDDDWASNIHSATISKLVRLPLEVGGNDFLYLGNGHLVSSWDGTTWINAHLNLPDNAIIQDIKWHRNRLWITANQPNLSGTNKVTGSIFTWDGVSSSWEEEIRVNGRVGGMIVKSGVLYVFYQEISGTELTAGNGKLGYIINGQVQELASFKNDIPDYYQITEYRNFIIWSSSATGNDFIYAWGAIESSLPAMLFQLADTGHNSATGGLASPFGTPIIASYGSPSSFQLAKFSGYTTTANWKSLSFMMGPCRIVKMVVYTEVLGTNARADFTLTYDGGSSIALGNIAAADNLVRKSFKIGQNIESDFRIEIDWANGNITNPASIKKIEIFGIADEKF